MKRYSALEVIARSLGDSDLVVSSTGMISRELFTVADSERNFYMIGSMGLASSIGLGLALCLPERRIVVIDGDGAVLMNMGSLATIGHFAPPNLLHVVLDNEAHDSTGGQGTASSTARLEAVARAAGYPFSRRVASEDDLRHALDETPGKGTAFILARVEKGAMEDVGRVTHSPEEIKARFLTAVARA